MANGDLRLRTNAMPGLRNVMVGGELILIVIYIGTAGWAIPSNYKDELPGAGSHLARYAQRLNAVEINSSFYRHHRVETYLRWASSVPPRLRFSVKAPQALTHEGGLTPEPEVLDRFVAEVAGLGKKLGVLLIQLPPRLEFDARVASRFFNALHKRIDAPLACEPRHPSWNSQRADKLLVKNEVARVAADPPPWPRADEPGGFRELAYFRWHGQPRKYYSNYDEARLASLRQQMSDAGRHASQIWSIFDNTVLGHALGNALAMTNTMRRSRARR
jgi:uncharacterized protein YecE (DUF72 family)